MNDSALYQAFPAFLHTPSIVINAKYYASLHTHSTTNRQMSACTCTHTQYGYAEWMLLDRFNVPGLKADASEMTERLPGLFRE